METRVPVFLDHLARVRRYSPHTVAAYRRDLADFCAFLTLKHGSLPRVEAVGEEVGPVPAAAIREEANALAATAASTHAQPSSGNYL